MSWCGTGHGNIPFSSNVLILPWVFLLCIDCPCTLYFLHSSIFPDLGCCTLGHLVRDYLPAFCTQSLIHPPRALLATSIDPVRSASIWNTKGRAHLVHVWCQTILKGCWPFSNPSVVPSFSEPILYSSCTEHTQFHEFLDYLVQFAPLFFCAISLSKSPITLITNYVKSVCVHIEVLFGISINQTLKMSSKPQTN